MAGFFNYLGRTFTEKGAWYKILFFVALQFLMLIFLPKDNSAMLAQGGELPEINVPACILCVFVLISFSGFSLQVYSNAMKTETTVFPEFDIGAMLGAFFRFIPVILVWGVYLFLITMLMVALSFVSKAIPIVLFAIFAIVAMFTIPILIAIFCRNFSYKFVLNPLTPFRIFSRVFVPMLVLFATAILISLLANALFFGGSLLIGVSAVGEGGTAPSALAAMLVLAALFSYFNICAQVAVTCTVANITKTRLADTEFFDDDFAPVEPSGGDDDEDYGTNGSDESLDY